MKSLIFSFVFLHLSSTLVANYVLALDAEGIVGGDLAMEGMFKYQVSIQKDGEGTCGGGIIADQFILTAAHCVVNETGVFEDKPYKVVADSVDLRTSSGVKVSVDKAYVPSGYLSSESADDIAVLKLKEGLNLDKNLNLSKLDLPLSSKTVNYTGKTAVIAGYGYTWVKTLFNLFQLDGGSDWKLKYANVTMIGKEECELTNFNITMDIDRQVCGRLFQRDPEHPEGICSGDSGSPLVMNNTVIGVVSRGPVGCEEDFSAAKYTRVSFFLKFIKQVLEGQIDGQIRMFTFPEENKSTERDENTDY